MPTDRYAVIRGPALVTFVTGASSYKMISEGDVTVDYGITTATQSASIGADIATFRTSSSPVVSFTPLGLTGYLPLLMSLAALPYGGTMVGAMNNANPAVMADNTLIVQPLNQAQQQQTFYGVGISAAPGVTFSANASLFDGTLSFKAAGKNAVAVTDPAKYFDYQQNVGAVNYDPAQLVRQAYTITSASINGGQPFQTAGGAKLALGLKATDLKSDAEGVYDISFGGLTPVITLTPIGITQAALEAALHVQGPGAAIGSNITAAAGNLDIVGVGVFARLPLAGIRKAGIVHGATADLIGAVEFVGGVAVNQDGTLAQRFYVGTVAPA